MELHTTLPAETVPVNCYHAGCEEQVSPNNAVWFNLGISHYNKETGVSYIQVHTSPYCCSDAHAVAHAHERANSHKTLEHGVFDAAILNPKGEHPDELVKQNAEYSPLGIAWASLPKVDALSGLPLGDDIYVPHIDRWCNQVPKGMQGSYHQATGILGCSTLEGAIKLTHVLIDEVLTPKPVEFSPAVTKE